MKFPELKTGQKVAKQRRTVVKFYNKLFHKICDLSHFLNLRIEENRSKSFKILKFAIEYQELFKAYQYLNDKLTQQWKQANFSTKKAFPEFDTRDILIRMMTNIESIFETVDVHFESDGSFSFRVMPKVKVPNENSLKKEIKAVFQNETTNEKSSQNFVAQQSKESFPFCEPSTSSSIASSIAPSTVLASASSSASSTGAKAGAKSTPKRHPLNDLPDEVIKTPPPEMFDQELADARKYLGYLFKDFLPNKSLTYAESYDYILNNLDYLKLLFDDSDFSRLYFGCDLPDCKTCYGYEVKHDWDSYFDEDEECEECDDEEIEEEELKNCDQSNSKFPPMADK